MRRWASRCFSDNAALEASGPEIVAELAAAHPDYDTIIVAVGDDLSAGSRVLEPGEAMQIANEAESSAGLARGRAHRDRAGRPRGIRLAAGESRRRV